MNKKISIIGQGPENTIINGGGVSRVFYINGENNNESYVSIENLTITNGYAHEESIGSYSEQGGAVMVQESALLLENLVIYDNHSSNGIGAIRSHYSDLIIRNSLIHSNDVLDWHTTGGIKVSFTNLQIENSTIVNNEEVSLEIDYDFGGRKL